MTLKLTNGTDTCLFPFFHIFIGVNIKEKFEDYRARTVLLMFTSSLLTILQATALSQHPEKNYFD